MLVLITVLMFRKYWRYHYSYFKKLQIQFNNKQKLNMGGSPGLVVMGGDSRSEGRGFESQRRIFFHINLM